MDSEVDGSALTGLDNLIVKLFLHLCYNFFDACRVDTSVGNKLVECKAANLSADRVEGGDNNGLRCIVYYNFHSRCCFESTDVAALSTDDASLHFVIVDVEYAYRVFYCRFRCYALYL